jgi:hypothetical protein
MAEQRQQRQSGREFYPFNPYTGQGYGAFGTPGPMNFNLGNALQAAINSTALPMHRINAPVSMGLANAQSSLDQMRARTAADQNIAKMQTQAALARERMRNQTLDRILGMFNQSMGSPAFMPVTTNYGAQAGPTNYQPGVR